MTTLHLCHWQGRKHLQSHLGLIGSQDSLVIYGAIESTDKLWINQNLQDSVGHWHLVNTSASLNNTQHEINIDQWLKLIIEHNNTLAWK